MFFELSKIAWVLIEPLNLLTLLLAVACVQMWSGHAKHAKYIVTSVVALLLTITVLPIGDALLHPLEQRFGPPERLPTRVDGIILLGGAQMPLLTRAYGQAALNGAAETMTTFLALARTYPAAKLVFSGESGDILNQDVSEADTVKLFLEQQGFDKNRVLYETRSRNTYENAVFSKELAKPGKGQVWLLVTSASHMPRSVGVFRKADWKVTPVPCDFNALPTLRPFQRLSVRESLLPLTLGFREWFGLIAYFVTQKTDALFPAPD